MIKKIFALGIIVVILFSFAACGNDYAYQEGDFSLEVTMDKTTAVIGEEVSCLITF